MTTAREDWDREAATFDDAPDHGLRDPVTREAWRALLRQALPAPPARLADLGCGTGTLSRLLAEEGYDVTGVDVSPAMLAHAARKAPGVTFLEGDAGAPPLPQGVFDVVLSRREHAEVTALDDPVLWGGPTGDQRYLLVSLR